MIHIGLNALLALKDGFILLSETVSLLLKVYLLMAHLCMICYEGT
jgi:hypothetical protein